MRTLAEFFASVTGREMLPYQARLGVAPFTSSLLIVPTGLGKTDAVLIPWLYAVENRDVRAPARLVFTLPRQNLTEQVARNARERVRQAGLEPEVRVLELMGGSRDNERDLAPDERTIIVGTQDMLLSRALNRGYARRPYRWPLDFGLLNNDCLWVLDEIQLMSDGLATSTQLAAFREQYGVFGGAPCIWMSATADPGWLETVDFASKVPRLRTVRLEADDFENPVVKERVYANKELRPAPVACRTPDGCAEFVVSQHRAGELSLVIANTVPRAREIAGEIRKRTAAEVVLLHSRFRPQDREQHVEKLLRAGNEGRIVVSTQVVEAGIDISAHRLVTDVAPWGSLVQRFGRVNRYGEVERSQIWWVDRPLAAKRHPLAAADSLTPKEAEKVFAPYCAGEVEASLAQLGALKSASPAALPKTSGSAPGGHVLRRADLLDLFDTTPDLAGNAIDVSRFIRSGEERNCYVAWREWEGEFPAATMPRVADREHCGVPIEEARDFAKKHPVFAWNFLQGAWVRVGANRWYPGMIVVTRSSEGGYTPDDGWSPGSSTAVSVVEEGGDEAEEEDVGDPRSWVSCRQSLQGHTEMVVAAVRKLVDALEPIGVGTVRGDLETAAAKHDWGKAHDVMQRTLHGSTTWTELLAKQERGKGARQHERRHFRHELASALAMIGAGDSDLAAYLAAAHHGRIRMTVRSMPGERTEGMGAIARGIRDGDKLAACELAGGVEVSETRLSLDAMQLGSGEDASISWTERVLRLRDSLGPFRLAFLEMLLRIADERASAEVGGGPA